MRCISYGQARRTLGSLIRRVIEDRESVLIHRSRRGNVVVLAEDDYRSLEETAYLLRSPANARRLLGAVERDRRGAPGRPFDEALAEFGLTRRPERADPQHRDDADPQNTAGSS